MTACGVPSRDLFKATPRENSPRFVDLGRTVMVCSRPSAVNIGPHSGVSLSLPLRPSTEETLGL
jgi:hypothetical protein